jgi:hypothetical protein
MFRAFFFVAADAKRKTIELSVKNLVKAPLNWRDNTYLAQSRFVLTSLRASLK